MFSEKTLFPSLSVPTRTSLVGLSVTWYICSTSRTSVSPALLSSSVADTSPPTWWPGLFLHSPHSPFSIRR